MFSVTAPKIIGPPVDWNACLSCGREMGAEEDRYRIELGGRIGIGHKGCQDIQLGKVIAVRTRPRKRTRTLLTGWT